MGKGVDYDYELSNGWDKWQNLVLQGLRELKEEQGDQSEKLADLNTKVALLNQKVEAADTTKLDERLTVLETNSVTQKEVKQDRRWLVGIVLAVIGSIIVPLGAVTAGLIG